MVESSLKHSISRQDGQTFIEFILLLAVLMLISWVFLFSFKHALTGFWEAFIIIVSYPTTSTIKFQ